MPCNYWRLYSVSAHVIYYCIAEDDWLFTSTHLPNFSEKLMTNLNRRLYLHSVRLLQIPNVHSDGQDYNQTYLRSCVSFFFFLFRGKSRSLSLATRWQLQNDFVRLLSCPLVRFASNQVAHSSSSISNAKSCYLHIHAIILSIYSSRPWLILICNK